MARTLHLATALLVVLLAWPSAAVTPQQHASASSEQATILTIEARLTVSEAIACATLSASPDTFSSVLQSMLARSFNAVFSSEISPASVRVATQGQGCVFLSRGIISLPPSDAAALVLDETDTYDLTAQATHDLTHVLSTLLSTKVSCEVAVFLGDDSSDDSELETLTALDLPPGRVQRGLQQMFPPSPAPYGSYGGPPVSYGGYGPPPSYGGYGPPGPYGGTYPPTPPPPPFPAGTLFQGFNISIDFDSAQSCQRALREATGRLRRSIQEAVAKAFSMSSLGVRGFAISPNDVIVTETINITCSPSPQAGGPPQRKLLQAAAPSPSPSGAAGGTGYSATLSNNAIALPAGVSAADAADSADSLASSVTSSLQEATFVNSWGVSAVSVSVSPTATEQIPASVTPVPAPEDDGGTSKATIIGLSVGMPILAALIVAAALLVWRRRRAQSVNLRHGGLTPSRHVLSSAPYERA